MIADLPHHSSGEAGLRFSGTFFMVRPARSSPAVVTRMAIRVRLKA